jgi:hypothetical protein
VVLTCSAQPKDSYSVTSQRWHPYAVVVYLHIDLLYGTLLFGTPV